MFAFGPLTAPTHPELPNLSHTPMQRACGVATDSHGNLYVSEQTAKTVSVFSPAGTLITSFSTTTTLANNPCKLAVSASGAVYVVNSNRSEARKFVPSQFPPVSSPAPTTYSVNTTLNGNGYLAFSPTLANVSSISIDPTNEQIYVAQDTGNEIQEYTTPSESYKLRCEGDETAATLTPASTTTDIKTALEAAPVECKTVTVAAGNPTTRTRVTFSGTMASKDVPEIEIVKGGCTVEVNCEKAFEMFAGASADHVVKYSSAGVALDKTIGSFVAGADYQGVNVYGKNGNVYLTDIPHKQVLVLNNAGNQILASFNGSDAPAGAFNFLAGVSLAEISVDQANGHAYVTDLREHGSSASSTAPATSSPSSPTPLRSGIRLPARSPSTTAPPVPTRARSTSPPLSTTGSTPTPAPGCSRLGR